MMGYEPKKLPLPEWMPIHEITVDPANVRTHKQKNTEAIAGSLKRFGQQKPIVIDDSGVVIAGSGTLEAARSLGWKHIWAVMSDLKGAERVAYAITDNRTGELAEWDWRGLSMQLQSLVDEGVNLDELGWGEHDLEPLLTADWSPREPSEAAGEGSRTITFGSEQWEEINKIATIVRDRMDDPEMMLSACVVEAMKQYA